MTLQLFDVLVRVPLPSVVWELVLQYWEGSHQPLLQVPTEHLAAVRQLLEEEIRRSEAHLFPLLAIGCLPQLSLSHCSYMSLVPDHLSSCKAVMHMEDSGLEQYLTEAHQQVARYRALTFVWNNTSWNSKAESMPAARGSGELGSRPDVGSELYGSSSEHCCHEPRPGEATPSPACPTSPHSPQSSGRSPPLHSVCEGPFLAAMLTKLERLLDQVQPVLVALSSHLHYSLPPQPYEINLLLTSILSSLAALPLPTMDLWLFSTQCIHHSRNVYSVLQKVSLFFTFMLMSRSESIYPQF